MHESTSDTYSMEFEDGHHRRNRRQRHPVEISRRQYHRVDDRTDAAARGSGACSRPSVVQYAARGVGSHLRPAAVRALTYSMSSNLRLRGCSAARNSSSSSDSTYGVLPRRNREPAPVAARLDPVRNERRLAIPSSVRQYHAWFASCEQLQRRRPTTFERPDEVLRPSPRNARAPLQRAAHHVHPSRFAA